MEKDCETLSYGHVGHALHDIAMGCMNPQYLRLPE